MCRDRKGEKEPMSDQSLPGRGNNIIGAGEQQGQRAGGGKWFRRI